MIAKTKTLTIKISDLDCASCVVKIETNLKKIAGVQAANVNYVTGIAQITYDPAQASSHLFVTTIRKLGYKPLADINKHKESLQEGHNHGQVENTKLTKKRFYKLLAATIGTGLIVFLTLTPNIEHSSYFKIIICFFILAWPGNEFFKRGFAGLSRALPNMDTLVALGTLTAFAYSAYNLIWGNKQDEYLMDAAIITTFILLGRYLENRAKGRASTAIQQLLKLSAKVAHKYDGQNIVDINIDQIQPGDVLLVKPGEKIPTDGSIIEGQATIDESMVTGESIPTQKTLGATVIGATINGNTSFKMSAEKVGNKTLLAQIIRMVQDAQLSKAPIQKLVDKVASYFVWGVILIAIGTFAVWFWQTNNIVSAMLPTVAVLIIACPCALGLATPISIIVGTGKGAELGILLKKPESLEKIHSLTSICFDKTGTITLGKPVVKEFVSIDPKLNQSNLELAYGLESHSDHPLAKSIIDFAKPHLANQLPSIHEFENLTGAGIKAKLNNKIYYLGTLALAKKLKIQIDKEAKEQTENLIKTGHTIVLLFNEKSLLAFFAIKDPIKTNAKSAIDALKKRKITPIMLTGDNSIVAATIAQEVGIKEFKSDISPNEKLAFIENLQKANQVVGMVGDGINDSPALAKADIGIAMGTGTDIAIESGDIVLVKGDLNKAVTAIELSEATLRNIKQNLFWAFLYNTISLPIAALGFLNPSISAFAMAFSSVSVVINALRLKRFKRGRQ